MTLKLEAPWQPVGATLPQVGTLVIWMDVDGSYHLASLDGSKVRPVVYDGDDVWRLVNDHTCWQPIPGAWISIDQTSPPQDEELLWLDDEDRVHLGRLQGREVKPEVYGNADYVSHSLHAYKSWQRILEPVVQD